MKKTLIAVVGMLVATSALGLNLEDIPASNTVKHEGKKEGFGSMSAIFQAGGRSQRVRFFVNDDAENGGSLFESPNMSHLFDDPVYANGNYSALAAPSSSPDAYDSTKKISRDTQDYGLVVNPVFMGCAMDILRAVKSAADTKTGRKIFNAWNIDEINVFLQPVVKFRSSDSLVEIAEAMEPPKPNDPALNIRRPVRIKDGKCAVPKKADLVKAFVKADKAGRERRDGSAL